MARRYVNPVRPAAGAGPHQQLSESHSRLAYGDDGEDSLTTTFEPAGAKLDSFPWARRWSAYLSAVGDPHDRLGAQSVIRRVMEESRPRNASGMSERVPAEGGFLVPENLRSECLSYLTAAVIWPRATVIPMDSLRVPVPLLDNFSQASSAQALGGMTFSFIEEGAAFPSSTPNFGRLTLEAWKLGALLANAPNELLSDSASFTDHFLPRVVGEGLAWVLDDYFIGGTATGNGGTGVGQPQSLINAPGAKSVTRTNAGQAPVFLDIVAMYKALHPAAKQAASVPGQGAACWLLSASAMDAILELYYNPTGTEVVPPSGWFDQGNADNEGSRLLGIPAVVTDHQPASGSAGDVILGDCKLYLIGDRQELVIERSQRGPTFINDTSHLRIKTRVDGRYWTQSTVVTETGQVVSPLVVLH
jgi:HK97 family phage major capsid protein